MGWRVPERPVKNNVIEDDIHLSHNYRELVREVFNTAKSTVHDDKQFFEEHVASHLGTYFDSLSNSDLENSKIGEIMDVYYNLLSELLRSEEYFDDSLSGNSALAIVYDGLAYDSAIKSFYSILTEIGIYLFSPNVENKENEEINAAVNNSVDINLVGCAEFINNQEYCDLREVINRIGNNFNLVNSW